jgi:hypothetical protein
MKYKLTIVIVVACLLTLPWASFLSARVKMVSLPERGDVVIRLDNPAATLIEEERVVSLAKGINRVDFSWNGVNIDPDSIRLALLSHPDRVRLLNVSYPPAEAALIWEISSAEAWEERIRVSYLLSGIDRLYAYKALADESETRVLLRGQMVLRNFSGEDFHRARMVSGIGEPIRVESRHEETKRVVMLETEGVPITKVWTFDAAVQPWDPDRVAGNVGIPVSYRIENTPESGLGAHLLPAGKVRVFQQEAGGGSLFLGEDRIEAVAPGEAVAVRIGDSRDILVTQHRTDRKQIHVRRNKKNRIVLYDQEEKIRAKLENFKNAPARLTLVEHIPGHWEMKSATFDYELEDAQTLVFEIDLAPGEKKTLNLHYVRKNIRP